MVLVHCTLSHCQKHACIPSLESFGPMMTKLHYRQKNPDDAATVAADNDESNPYKLPSQATQKLCLTHLHVMLITCVMFYSNHIKLPQA